MNFLGHPLTVIDDNGNRTRIQSYGRYRVKSNMKVVEEWRVGDAVVPLLTFDGEQTIEGLPDPEPGVIYVVDGLVASVANRGDVVAPSRVTRGPGGRVEECRAFLRPAPKGVSEE